MISLLFFSLAVICNAVMDEISHHYSQSIFHKNSEKHNKWWNPEVSWKNKYKNGVVEWGRNSTPIIFSDAWHLFKGLMLLFFILSIITFDAFFLFQTWWMFLPISLIYIILYWTIFELFYKYLLIK